MCEFCSKHTRKKWFLDPHNYAEEMLKNRRRKSIVQKVAQGWDYYLRDSKKYVDWANTPIIGKLAKPFLNELVKYEHAGQIITLKDALAMIDLSDNHVVFPCACRKLISNDDKMCCINFGPMRDLTNRETKMEEVDRAELKYRVKEWYAEGLFLDAMYVAAPFPVSICSCDRKYCISAKYRFDFNYPMSLLKGHEVAIVNPFKCKGDSCNFECIVRCPFGAMYVDKTYGRVVIDPKRCFGCGLCVTACTKGAITLEDRQKVPGAKGLW